MQNSDSLKVDHAFDQISGEITNEHIRQIVDIFFFVSAYQ